jgi:hypothetical protein
MIIRLFDEVALMSGLCEDTLRLIHATQKIQPIKLLIEAHDIISLNLSIKDKFEEFRDGPPWDLCALKQLNGLRQELFIFYRMDFHPPKMVDIYSTKVEHLYKVAKRRLTNAA